MIGIIIVGFIILGALLTIPTFINGRTTKNLIKEIIFKLVERVDERHKEMKELIVEESKLTQELIAKIGSKE